MAFKKNETKVNTTEKNVNNNARVTIVGKVVDVIEGKKYNYLKVHADRTKINPKTNTPYYDEFSIKFDKSITLPTDEVTAVINATLSPFYDKDRQCTIIVIEGESIDTNASSK